MTIRTYEVNHTTLIPSIYKKSVSGMITTWDIRISSLGYEGYITSEVLHTIEHTLSDYLQTRYGSYRVVGVFVKGCHSGVYVLTRFIDKKIIFEAIVDYIMSLQRLRTIPRMTEQLCSNHTMHDLESTKKVMLDYYQQVLKFQYSAVNYNR